MEPIKLTSFSHGAGCGCKIAPAVLDKILSTSRDTGEIDSNLLVGNSTNDDAAVYDIGNGQAIVSTTDFFMPIVDDPFDFGAVDINRFELSTSKGKTIKTELPFRSETEIWRKSKGHSFCGSVFQSLKH